jgi:two-component system OmpR family sensor kinase
VSLRARLIIGLLVLAGVGLITLAAVTYAEQRSFLYDRADQQLAASKGAVSHQLDQAGAVVQGGAGQAPGAPGYNGGGGSGGLGFPNSRGGGDGDGNGPPPEVQTLSGTFGQRRDASGRKVGKNVTLLSYGQRALAAPKLPAKMAVGKPVTVSSVGGSGLKYRAEAFVTGDQPGTTIVAVPLRDVTQTLHRLERVELLVIAGVLVALGLLSWWLVGIGLRPLDRMGDTAGAIAAGELSQRIEPADSRTEVGRLGLALNEMLSQIETAFAERTASENRLRRFLADASHELRTPLVSIRGYAELFRIGAARKQDDTEKAMRRIEEEATRMGVLVEDMLTLARLDELREPVREPVELGRVTADAVADARAVAPSRTIELVAESPGNVLGDPHQLRQVVANLMRNALTHTPAGTPVEIRVSADGDDALLEVRDHGPGLPPGDPGELFERFWRAEPGRERAAGGAGLGLAIVAAIVDAHGGSVSASNADGGGASFVIRLPAHRPAAVAGSTET